MTADLRFALRYFARHKATVAIIVTVLALGTGANTLIFSLVQAEFFRPAPALSKDAARVRIWMQQRNTRSSAFEIRGFTTTEYAALAQRQDILRDVAGWIEDDVILQAGDSASARGVTAQFVTPNYFASLRLTLAAGAGFARNSDAADLTAVMSFKAATDTYGSAAAAIGQRILVNEVPLRVVGVAPERFQGAKKYMDEPAVWMPLSARTAVSRVSPRWTETEPALSLFGRTAPGVSRDQATAYVRQVVASTLPDSAARVGMTRTGEVRDMLRAAPGAETSSTILEVTAISSVAILVLLVAWMNVSSLMVAAAVGRRHEVAVRLSLGASRGRLLRQLVTESTALALVGGVLGLVAAWWVLAWQSKVEIDGVNVMPDAGTLAFTLGIALATGIVFGLSPALHATRGRLAEALRDARSGSAARSRLQRGFVVAQIVLSQPLLIVLGIALSFVVSDYKPLAPETSTKLISVWFRPLKNGAENQRAEAVTALLPRIAEQPEVVGAVPESDAFDVRGVFMADHGQRVPGDSVPTVVHLAGSAPGWFSLVDAPILLGRDVSYADTLAADYPIVIGSDLARVLWGNTNPVGRTLLSPALPGLKQDSISMTVIGVFDATRRLPGMTFNGGAARSDVTTQVYTARDARWMHDRVLVRTRAPAAQYLPELQKFLHAAAPALPVTRIHTLAQEDERMYREMLKGFALAGAGGGLALLLATLGLYGVVSLAVQQRTREIGVRLAVGARPAQVARMFVVSGLRTSAFALMLGLPVSLGAIRIALSQGLVIAPGVSMVPITLVIVTLLLCVATAATWVPARRASRVDPSTTLRTE
ncbi:MAG TPA: ABC transporter permease [Gemmatimonadaceae bacterium]|nr:ABC transporter permease [Gemmatimonadaceae bacterium]